MMLPDVLLQQVNGRCVKRATPAFQSRVVLLAYILVQSFRLIYPKILAQLAPELNLHLLVARTGGSLRKLRTNSQSTCSSCCECANVHLRWAFVQNSRYISYTRLASHQCVQASECPACFSAHEDIISYIQQRCPLDSTPCHKGQSSGGNVRQCAYVDDCSY